MSTSKPTSLSFTDRFGMGAQNALELIRVGRFADPDHAPFSVVHSDRVYKLRHYGDDQHRPRLKAPILLVPPLMVTSEVYDIAPDISSVRVLLASGLDVWLVDYGAPEREEAGATEAAAPRQDRLGDGFWKCSLVTDDGVSRLAATLKSWGHLM